MKNLLFITLFGCCLTLFPRWGAAENPVVPIRLAAYVEGLQKGQRVIYGMVYETPQDAETRDLDPSKDPLQHKTLFLNEPDSYPDGEFYQPFPEIYQAVRHIRGVIKDQNGETVSRFETDDDGHFLLYDIPEGRYHVYVEDRATGRTGGGEAELLYQNDRAYLLVYLQENVVLNEPNAYYPPEGGMGTPFPLSLFGLLGLIGLSGDDGGFHPHPVSPSMPQR